MSCPVPCFQELAFRELLHRAQQPNASAELLDEAFEQSLVGLKMTLEGGCPSCVSLAVTTLHQLLGWPASRDHCLLMIEERLKKVAVH
jgi:hypothetical protein